MKGAVGGSGDQRSMCTSVIGGGPWGRALARAAGRAGGDVRLYSRRDLPDAEPTPRAATLQEAAAHAELILLAVPASGMRTLATELGPHLHGGHMLVHAGRGLVDSESLAPLACPLMSSSRILREETPVRKLGALGGPALATELLDGSPTILAVASRYPEVRDVVSRALSGPTMRVYPSDDLIGLEWASALSGILAVAVGYARGIGLRPGVLAAFATRGVHEAANIAAASGAHRETFLGLAGFGDLLAAMGDSSRPEIVLGQELARGVPLARALEELGSRIEAVELAPKISQFAKRARVPSRIFDAIAEGLLTGRDAKEVVSELMQGPVVSSA